MRTRVEVKVAWCSITTLVFWIIMDVEELLGEPTDRSIGYTSKSNDALDEPKRVFKELHQ
jgi:hypothetical protein